MEPTSKNIKTLYKYDTVLSADSVEWCPHAPFQHFFVCANYQLIDDAAADENSPKRRTGRILLFSIDKNSGLKLHQTVDTAAVLDTKWCHCVVNGCMYLGVVNAVRTLEIYKLDAEEVVLKLVTKYELEDDGSETLILSLDWSTGKFCNEEPEIVCSNSKGNVNLFKLSNDKLELLGSFNGHSFECWIAAFDYWDPNVFFSGGDDCLFLKFDKRCETPVIKNKRHEAGVTSMHSNKNEQHLFATGSYDQNVRLWDLRSLKSPLNFLQMPGPLWRLKWNQNYLLSACMLGGVHVIDTKNNKMQICKSYYEHKNIAYGADWCYLSQEEVNEFEGEGNCVIGTCSFYDHLLCVSKLEINF